MAELEGKLPESKWSLSALNFPSSGYFPKIFGMHLQKRLVYLYTKKFLPPLLHFWNYSLFPNGQIISLIGDQAIAIRNRKIFLFLMTILKHTSKHSSWGLNGTKYWKLFIVEYLQPNKFKERRNFVPIYQVSCFSSLGNASSFHVYPEKGRLSLSAQRKKIIFLRKNTIFPDNTRKIMCRRSPLWKDHLFRTSGKRKYGFPCNVVAKQ